MPQSASAQRTRESAPGPSSSREPSGINGVKLAAFLMLGGAAWSFAQRLILSHWIVLEPAGYEELAAAFAQLVLAIALLQGSEEARKFVLWISGLAALLMIVVLPVMATEARLWLIGGSAFLGAASLFGLVLARNVSAPRAVLSVLVIVASWAGMTVGLLQVLGGTNPQAVKNIRDWAAPERSYKDEPSGLALGLPEGWVFLKDGNPVLPVPPKTTERTMAHTTVTAYSVLMREDGGNALTLDHYLDAVFKNQQREAPSLKEDRRVDVQLGGAAARKMWTTWTERRVRLRGSVTVWRDRERFFRLFSWFPNTQAKEAEVAVTALEHGVRFTSPLDTLAKEKLAEIGPACPLLSPGVIRMLSEKLPKDATADVYFRQGYQWAVRGQQLLEPKVAAELKTIMTAVFAAIPEAKREALGVYVEKLNFDRATTAAEDKATNELLSGAIAALPESDRLKLQQITEQAIELGRLM